MPGYLLHQGLTAQCPHGGQVSVTATNTRVKVSGQAVAVQGDSFLVSGCPFTVPTSKPQPCVKVQWITTATRVQAGGKAVLLQSCTGLCQSGEQLPQGPPTIVSTQTKVKGT